MIPSRKELIFHLIFCSLEQQTPPSSAAKTMASHPILLITATVDSNPSKIQNGFPVGDSWYYPFLVLRQLEGYLNFGLAQLGTAA